MQAIDSQAVFSLSLCLLGSQAEFSLSLCLLGLQAGFSVSVPAHLFNFSNICIQVCSLSESTEKLSPINQDQACFLHLNSSLEHGHIISS